MKSIFDKSAYQEVLNRLESLNESQEPLWGKMNSSQMLAHCRKAIELAMGDITIEPQKWYIKFIAGFYKETLYNDKPFKKNAPTTSAFIIKNTDEFNVELKQFKDKLHRIYSHKNYFYPYSAHPIFGRLEPYMWGQSTYKHIDHHFKQFGV